MIITLVNTIFLLGKPFYPITSIFLCILAKSFLAKSSPFFHISGGQNWELIGNYDHGGLRDLDLDTKIDALQTTWIKRLLDTNFHPWKIIPTFMFAKIIV